MAHQPKRDDEVAAWLRCRREEHVEHSFTWVVINALLDDYRLHADVGAPLAQEVREGPAPFPDEGFPEDSPVGEYIADQIRRAQGVGRARPVQ